MKQRSEMIEMAVSVFAAHTTMLNRDVLHVLIRMGLSEMESLELIEFVPLAFARLILADLGVDVSDEYVRLDANGTERVRRSLKDEPMYRDALALGPTVAARDKASFMATAGRSAEFQMVNSALLRGDKPENLVLTTPILGWDE
jgi:hypothetical protein